MCKFQPQNFHFHPFFSSSPSVLLHHDATYLSLAECRSGREFFAIAVICRIAGTRDSSPLDLSQQKCHIERQRQKSIITPHVVISEFQGMIDMILFRMFQQCLHGFGIARPGLTFQWGAFSFVAHHKIDLYAVGLMIIIEFPPHLAKDIGHHILIDCPFLVLPHCRQPLMTKGLCWGVFFQRSKMSSIFLRYISD